MILVAMITWQIMDLKITHHKISFVTSKKISDSNGSLTSLQKNAVKQKDYFDYVEKVALWKEDEDPLSWLTQQANEIGLQVIGVERLATDRILDYEQSSFKISIRGDYDRIGMFVNRLEHSTNAFKINSFRMVRKDSTPDQTTMTLSLSYFRRVVNS
jgi:hypothetical protein